MRRPDSYRDGSRLAKSAERRRNSGGPAEALSGTEGTMAEILVLGISHYPPLAGPDDRMSTILRRMLQNPDLPPRLRTPDGWPEPMQAGGGDDAGTTADTHHRGALGVWGGTD